MYKLKYKDSIHTMAEENGYKKVVDLLIEEMSELTKALLKERRAMEEVDFTGYRVELQREYIVEEVADVEIVLEQLKYLHIPNRMVKEYMKEKIDRFFEEKRNEN